jgi:hypothetical protein
MEEYLVCENPKCRFLLSLREGGRVYRRSEIPLSACPECSQKWSGHCPFCVQILEVIWRNGVACCLHCDRELRPDANVDRAAG